MSQFSTTVAPVGTTRVRPDVARCLLGVVPRNLQDQLPLDRRHPSRLGPITFVLSTRGSTVNDTPSGMPERRAVLA